MDFTYYKEHIQELLDNFNDDEYNNHRVLSQISELCAQGRHEMSNTADPDIPNYILATNIYVEDCQKYLAQYLRDNYPNHLQWYDFKIYTTGRGKNTKELFLQTRPGTKSMHYGGLKSAVAKFAKGDIYRIIGTDQHKSLLSGEDFSKFLDARSENPEYFLPYVEKVTSCMRRVGLD